MKSMLVEKLANAQNDPVFAGRTRPHRYVLPLDIENKPKGQNIVTLDYTSAKAEVTKDNTVLLTHQQIADVACEFPAIYYKKYNGKKYKYFYVASTDLDTPELTGAILKVNAMTGEVKSFTEENTYCSEPYFIPFPSSEITNEMEAEEDDGILIYSMVKGEPDINTTGLLVLDAKTLKEIGRAEFKLKSPVPSPLHGCFAPLKSD